MSSSEVGAMPEGDQTPSDHNTDRYPNVEDVFALILEEEDLPPGPIERLEVTCLASGEATYRVWEPRAEEPTGGYFSEV